MRAVLHDLALPTFRRYAQRWDLAVHIEDLREDGSGADPAAQQAKWVKIELLREALTAYPLALWVDADVLILRQDQDIASHLRPGAFQSLAIEQVPHEHRVNPNTGIWLMRSCPMAFDFLDAVEALGPQPGPWADQGAVLSALGWDRGDERYWWAGPGRGSRFLDRTSWLPAGWNQPYLTGRNDENVFNGSADSYLDRPSVIDPHAMHFMGMTPAARYLHMAAFTGRCATQPTPADSVSA